MIYGIRMLGFHDSADALDREFGVMAAHFGQVGYLEGIVPEVMLWDGSESVIESVKPGEMVRRLDGSSHYAQWKGRRSLDFATREGDFEELVPRKQEVYRVHYVHEDEVPVEQLSAIVVQRQMPMVSLETPGLPGFAAVLATDEIGEFEIAVYDGSTPVLDGWVSLRCLVCQTTQGDFGVSHAQRVVVEAAVEESEKDAEVGRLMASARLYVKQAMGSTGDTSIDATRAVMNYVVNRTGKTGTSGSASTEEVLDAIRNFENVRELKVEPVKTGTEPYKQSWRVTAAVAYRGVPEGGVNGWETATSESLHEAALEVYAKLWETARKWQEHDAETATFREPLDAASDLAKLAAERVGGNGPLTAE